MDLTTWNKQELQDHLRKLELPVSGNKPELIERINIDTTRQLIELTGVPDVDIQILLRLNDSDISNMCEVNTYADSLCEYVWNIRIQQIYRVDLSEYKQSSTYKDIYKGLIKYGGTLQKELRYSARKGFLPLVKRLIVRVISRRFWFDSVLFEASTTGQLEVVEYSLENGANVHSESGDALILASRMGYLDIVKVFIEEADANIHISNDAALRLASLGGHLKIVKYLVEKGASIHSQYDAALINAAHGGYLGVVKYLIEQGSDVYAQNNKAIMQAEKFKRTAVIKYLDMYY